MDQLLQTNPDVLVRIDELPEVAISLAYLESDAALASLARDSYWPKWDSPWWHMLTLHEMGLADRIPKVAVSAMVEAMTRLPVKFFPLKSSQVEPEWDLVWDSTCHCAAGSLYALLSACGVKVDQELPWLRPWFLEYQMDDGGMSCDSAAYDVEGECPSSMVGLISPFEAMLFHVDEPTEKEWEFLDRGAAFLMERELRLGSNTLFNDEEKEQAVAWLQPCFPRLYLYDVLRGLHSLLAWCERRKQDVPHESIGAVVAHLARLAPDGKMRCQRLSFDGVPTRIPLAGKKWTRADHASTFPLLKAVSTLGEVSPFLTREWNECKRILRGESLVAG